MTGGTLLDAFSPPEGLVATGGVLVSMTATVDFLEEAMVRYTGMSARQRDAAGEIAAYLFLDAGEELLGPRAVPGIFQFAPSPDAPRRLLHAKLALLSFGTRRTGGPAVVRLVVTTGNWTQTSARRQLELAWSIDVPAVGSGRSAPARDRVDLAAAARFVEALSARYENPKHAGDGRGGDALLRRYDEVLRAAIPKKGSTLRPRFFHSLKTPLLAHIETRLGRAGAAERNALLCGSGSFEQKLPPGGLEVFNRLADLIVEPAGRSPGVGSARLDRIAGKTLVLDPNAAGAVALWKRQAKKARWRLRGARAPEGQVQRRKLHAKFIFVGAEANGRCAGHLYLGSGNLSKRGLILPPNGKGGPGNIEAGVFLKVASMRSEKLAEALCLDRSEVLDDENLKMGAEPPSEAGLKPTVKPPPLIVVRVDQRGLALGWSPSARKGVKVKLSWRDGQSACVAVGTPFVAFDGGVPATIHVTLGDDAWDVPVVGSDGSICRIPLPPSTGFEEGLLRLTGFPAVWEEAPADPTTDVEVTEPDPPDGGQQPPNSRNAAPGSYALHAAAMLVEQLAQVVERLSPAELLDFVRHLQLEAPGAFPERQVADWRELRHDFLAVLAAPGFLRLASEEARRRLERALRAIAKAWKLNHD